MQWQGCYVCVYILACEYVCVHCVCVLCLLCACVYSCTCKCLCLCLFVWRCLLLSPFIPMCSASTISYLKVKESVSMPVIANGDVWCGESSPSNKCRQCCPGDAAEPNHVCWVWLHTGPLWGEVDYMSTWQVVSDVDVQVLSDKMCWCTCFVTFHSQHTWWCPGIGRNTPIWCVVCIGVAELCFYLWYIGSNTLPHCSIPSTTD